MEDGEDGAFSSGKDADMIEEAEEEEENEDESETENEMG
jgi:hypothetical protein